MEEIVRSEIFQKALLGGSLTAVLCAAVGYFMVLRALAFASEALTDIGFAGATGSVLMGWNPFVGMFGLGLLAVFSLVVLRDRLKGRDVQVGMVLSFALGLGVLFISLYARSSATHASSGIGLLFGSLLSISGHVLNILLIVTLAVLVVLGLIFRPLLFASIDPGSAQAKGVPIRLLDLVYLLLLAATTAVSIQSMGFLLAFALLSAPAGAAHKLTRRPGLALLAAVLLGLGITWASLALAFFGPLKRIPVGFYIASFSALLYGGSLLKSQLTRRPRPEEHPRHREREISV
ncbi:MAG: metal ABC transporter permease [Spirochaetia bacterium]|jgi:zinc/manganese transport system permease protein